MTNPMLESFRICWMTNPTTNTISAIGLIKSISLLPRQILNFWPFGTFNLSAMLVCDPPEIHQARSQNPPHNAAVEIHDEWTKF